MSTEGIKTNKNNSITNSTGRIIPSEKRINTIQSSNVDYDDSINMKSNPTIVQLSDNDLYPMNEQDNFDSNNQKNEKRVPILSETDRCCSSFDKNAAIITATTSSTLTIGDNINTNTNRSLIDKSCEENTIFDRNRDDYEAKNHSLLNKETTTSNNAIVFDKNSWKNNASSKVQAKKSIAGVVDVVVETTTTTTETTILQNRLADEHTVNKANFNPSSNLINKSPDYSISNENKQSISSSSISIDKIHNTTSDNSGTNNFVKPLPQSKVNEIDIVASNKETELQQLQSTPSLNNNQHINFKVLHHLAQSPALIEPKLVHLRSLSTPVSVSINNNSVSSRSDNRISNVEDDELVNKIVDKNEEDDYITNFDRHILSTKSTELSITDINYCDKSINNSNKNSKSTSHIREQFVLSDLNNQIIVEEDEEEEGGEEFESEGETYSDENLGDFQLRTYSPDESKKQQSTFNFKNRQNLSTLSYIRSYLNRKLFNNLNFFSTNSGARFKSTSPIKSTKLSYFSQSRHPYKEHEDKDLLTGASKYRGGGGSNSSNNYKRINLGKKVGRTFRGSYRYSRIQITMAIFKKFVSMMVEKSTLALIGALLIHITLGTVYTLSNINSYLTSYMREHGSPNATYGGSMWISSSYAVGQGFSMVLGGYIEKRFSARLACFIGCILHSGSIMSTSWSVNHGPLAVLLTYGFIPGFGCGLAYMTPMSNGFGWYPNRKGLVAGIILAGFGIGTFIFNMAQTAYVNPDNLSPPENADGYFTQHSILDRVPHLFVFIGTIYAIMQFIGCCLLFKPPYSNISPATTIAGITRNGKNSKSSSIMDDERPILLDNEIPLKEAIKTREFIVLFLVYGITTQGVLFVNSMIKEYGQIFIDSDMYLAWTGSMASIANSLGRLFWGLAIDRFTFTQCFTSITIIFGSLMFIMPFEFVLSSRLLYLLCTLGLFGSFSGWMSTYPVHLSRVFGRTNSGMIYGLIFVSQSCGGILTALGAHYLIDQYNRFVPFFCVVILEILGLSIYHLFYPK